MTRAQDAYLLPQDDREIRRLNVQQSILARTIPNWPTFLDKNQFELQNGDKVLDSGVGTAYWLLDIASSVPKSLSVEFHGIDISSSKFPKQENIPSNVSLSLNSIQSLPKQWSSTFALVHQTFLIAALRREEWLTAINEIDRVLQPGGWVTLGEPGRFRKCGAHTKILENVLIDFYKYCSIERFIMDQLPDILASPELGFDRSTIAPTKYKLHLAAKRPDLASDSAQETLVRETIADYLSVFRHMREVMFERAAPAVEKYCRTISDFDKLLDDVEEEWNNATEGYIDFTVLVAQKV